MPETYTTEIPASSIKVGDYLGTSRGYVTKVDVKQKFTYVVDGNDSRPERIENTNKVRVSRQRPTKQEKYAAELAHFVRSMDSTEQAAERNLEAAREKVTEYLAKGLFLDHWIARDIAFAQANVEIWRRVTAEALATANRAAYDGEVVIDRKYDGTEIKVKVFTRVDVLRHNVAELERRLLEFGLQLESRSTSQMSNAWEDCDREVKLRFVRDWKRDLDMLDRAAADAQASV